MCTHPSLQDTSYDVHTVGILQGGVCSAYMSACHGEQEDAEVGWVTPLRFACEVQRGWLLPNPSGGGGADGTDTAPPQWSLWGRYLGPPSSGSSPLWQEDALQGEQVKALRAVGTGAERGAGRDLQQAGAGFGCFSTIMVSRTRPSLQDRCALTICDVSYRERCVCMCSHPSL